MSNGALYIIKMLGQISGKDFGHFCLGYIKIMPNPGRLATEYSPNDVGGAGGHSTS